MLHRRHSELGAFHHTNIELIIFVGIVGILAAIAMPILARRTDRKGRECLENLAYGKGRTDWNIRCPASGKPYGPVFAKDVETLSCPEPEDHLASQPRFVRTAGKPWTLEQTLPVYAGEPIEVKGSTVRIVEQPGRTWVFVKPSFASRWVLGLILGLFLGTLFVVFLVWIVRAAIRKEWAAVFGSLIAAGVSGVIFVFVFASAASSHQWVFEPAASRVTKISYVLGSAYSEKVLTGCLGVVPTGKVVVRLQLVHETQPDGYRVTTMEEIPPNRLDIASWFQRAVTAR